MRTSSRIFAISWVAIASCFGSASPCIAELTVALHGDAELNTATVRLSDLFSGVPSIIDRDIAQAPPPGRSAEYDAQVLQKLAEKYRLSWRPENLTDHVTLTTAATKITVDDLHAALVRKIEETGVHGNIETNFDNHTVEIDLPANQKPDFAINNFEFDPVSKRFHGDLAAGRGSSAVSVPIAGHAVVKRQVPILAHHMDAGSVIAMTDIDWITVNDDHVTPNVVTSVDQLIGHELRHAISDNDVVHTNDIIPARLVTRGSLVTLKVETSFMQLTAQGRALQDGAEGDVVRVNNTQSNRMIEGTVTGPGEVSVHMPSPKLASAQ